MALRAWIWRAKPEGLGDGGTYDRDERPATAVGISTALRDLWPLHPP